MKITKPGYYLTADKTIVKINEVDEHGAYSDKYFYFLNGLYFEDMPSKNDIIAEIPDKLMNELTRVINEYFTNEKFRIIIDKQ